ncbi:hypothetical protein ACWJJH_14205 [Endozoicomonadaceae bacterium StTr2]
MSNYSSITFDGTYKETEDYADAGIADVSNGSNAWKSQASMGLHPMITQIRQDGVVSEQQANAILNGAADAELKNWGMSDAAIASAKSGLDSAIFENKINLI